jgi:hypothetical protein
VGVWERGNRFDVDAFLSAPLVTHLTTPRVPWLEANWYPRPHFEPDVAPIARSPDPSRRRSFVAALRAVGPRFDLGWNEQPYGRFSWSSFRCLRAGARQLVVAAPYALCRATDRSSVTLTPSITSGFAGSSLDDGS